MTSSNFPFFGSAQVRPLIKKIRAKLFASNRTFGGFFDIWATLGWNLAVAMNPLGDH